MKAMRIHGDLEQPQRDKAIADFREGNCRVLIATDIAARGIDVLRISNVINYDMPDTINAYTHRVGRTGRAEKTGDAFSFITREDEDVVRSIERVLARKEKKRQR